jgi:hypothetical protein
MQFTKDILAQFYETKKFPEELCVCNDSSKPDIMYGDVKFECVIFNELWNQIDIRELKPYFWINNNKFEDIEEDKLFGWVDEMQNPYDHFENGIHNDICKVIGWRTI